MSRDTAAKELRMPSTNGTGPLRAAVARLGPWVFLGLIFILALTLRLIPLNRYVTPDEPAWVLRSMRFRQALVGGDLHDIPDTGHPGVTTMWLGSLGIEIQRWLAPDESARHLDWLDGLAGLSPESPAAFSHLAYFLPSGRVMVAAITSLGVLGIVILARFLWGWPVALLTAILLVLDPFLTGHSGLLHLDGLLATLMALSTLSALMAVFSFRPSDDAEAQAELQSTAVGRLARRPMKFGWIVVSGILAGLALLTKVPGGYMLPALGALLIAAGVTRRASWRQVLVSFVLWSLAACLTFMFLNPAFWADPGASLRQIFEVGERHIEGAIRPVFFRGQLTYEPGLAFYPVVWLFRVSPLVLIGLIVALIRYLPHPGNRRFAIVALVGFAFGFGLFVTLVGKKHDRYLLPALVPLTLVAALGWDEVRRSIARRLGGGKSGFGALVNRRSGIRLGLIGLVPAGLFFFQLVLIFPFLGTPLGFYNPLVGGPRAAVRWLEIGWGEGVGAAARWLNREPNAEELITATSSIPPFASYFVGSTMTLTDKASDQADYLVLPVQQGLQKPSLGPDAHAPVFEAQVGGITYASVISNPVVIEQVAFLASRVQEGDLVILDAPAALARAYNGPANLVTLSDVRDSVEVATHLDDLVPGRKQLWYVAIPDASPITARYIQQQLECYAQVVASESVAGISVTQLAPNGSHACGEVIRDESAAGRYSPNTTRFGGDIGLVDTFLTGMPISWPEHLPVVIRWDALASLSADYRAILRLKDTDGRIWATGGHEIFNADYIRPSTWSPGDWTDQVFQLVMPAGIPPGSYAVDLSVFDPDSGRALTVSGSDGAFLGLFAELGQVTVGPPAQPPSPWDVVIDERYDPSVEAGPLRLLGYSPPAAQFSSGDRVTFDLFWRAKQAPSADYALRWRLYTPEGDVGWTKVDSLSPFAPSGWRANELEQVRYDLVAAPELPAGAYVLGINVLDESGAPLWAEDVELAPIEIIARDRQYDMPSDVAYPLDLLLGSKIHLGGFDIGALSVQPGGQLPMTLYWQADGPTDVSYTVFVHLVGSDGMIHGQVDRPPVDGAAPTHTWVAGQVVVDECHASCPFRCTSGTLSYRCRAI